MRLKALVLLLVLLGSLPLAADTYPRQPLDVEHYRFALTLSDTTDRITGEATVRVRMLAAGVRVLTLDLAGPTPARADRGMTVERVIVDGAPATYTHSADRLTITLPTPSRDRQRIALVIRYAGLPADGLQIKPNRHGDRTFFSDNWPDKARQWLPTIDHISDKATMEMVVDAPAHYQVVSNGRRIEESDLPGGLRRTVWHESVPISPWLYALGVARFAVQHVGDYNGVPIETWVFAQDRDAGFYDFAEPTRQALAFYSERVGPYSYEKLANVQSNSVSGGMESASALFYAPGSVVGDRNTRWRNVVIHEIAHQWFGNAVTEHDWDDVWLSEGFATYFTQLFIEHAYGRDEFVENMRRSRQTILDFYAKTPDYRIVHDNLDDMSRVTTGMTYQKGAWVLHMLRQRMGDERFWAGIRTYYQRYKDASASTADFREVMEQSSGESLTAFFDQWLYRGGIPRLSVTWAWDATARTVTVDVKQEQPGPAFLLSLDLGVRAATGATRIERIDMTGASATATFKAEVEPVAIVVDPNVRLLMAAESKSLPAPALDGADYLYLWTASADRAQPDFLAVLDVTERSERYGRLVTTLPVPGLKNGPHHTEHEMPADGQLFANGFGSGQSFIFDLSSPATPRLAGQFGDMEGYSHPHSFLRMPNGHVLATFQMRHEDGVMRPGGLVELTPDGRPVRSSAPAGPGVHQNVRVYSGAIIPSLDRIVTTTSDMEKDFPESRNLQVWRLSDLSLLHTFPLPDGPAGNEGLLTAEPRLLEDGRTLLVSTFNCGLYLIEGLDGNTPSGRMVASFPQRDGTSCAIPVVSGHYYLVTVPAWRAVVSLDISTPSAPREVSRLTLGDSDVPHWIALAPDRRRIVITGYAGLRHRALIARVDPATGRLSLDERFREEGASEPGFRMDNKTWPHGGTAKGVPHGAVFSRR